MAPKPSAPKPYKAAADAKDEEAMDLIANWARPGTAKKFPSQLKTYLKENQFRMRPPTNGTANVHPHEVAFADEQIIVRALLANTPIQGFPLRFDAYVVRMIERVHGQAIQIFEPGNFVTVDLSTPNPTPRVVVTVQLQGCSFVIGQDKNNRNLLHLGHAQPAGSQVANPSVVLAKHFKDAALNDVFLNQELKKKWVIGGYGPDIQVKVIGWVSAGKLFLAIKKPDKVTTEEYP